MSLQVISSVEKELSAVRALEGQLVLCAECLAV
jgi:hypothetical protein